jgi:hypothetical protein
MRTSIEMDLSTSKMPTFSLIAGSGKNKTGPMVWAEKCPGRVYIEELKNRHTGEKVY